MKTVLFCNVLLRKFQILLIILHVDLKLDNNLKPKNML